MRSASILEECAYDESLTPPDISDAAWALLKPHLPAKRAMGRCGKG